MLTLLSGAALGAGTMYLLDPDRGASRRAEAREALRELGDRELVRPVRDAEPIAVAQDLGTRAVRLVDDARTALASAGWMPASRPRGWRRRASELDAHGWALVGGLAGAVVAGLWLAGRALRSAEGIEVIRTMTVDAPVERVYEFWNDFENFPRFMSHVREVKRVGPERTHWVVAGPGGAPIEWDAIVSRRIPNQEVAWRTVAGSLVEHEGCVRFRPLGARGTEIEIEMTYRPVGGALGQGVAALFGRNPDRVVGDDLARVAAELGSAWPAAGESGLRR
jgi:uncharacterized membrane protein